LLEWLEQVPSALEDNQRANAPLRFAVQYVLRGFDAADGSARGYAGRIGSGVVVPGQQVRILPSGSAATVHSVSTYDGDLAVAQPGQSVVVRLDREVDVSRGDWLVDDDPDTQPIQTRQFAADLAWLDSEPLALQRRVWLRHGTRWVQARVKRIDSLLDLGSVEWRDDLEPTSLGPNDIARVVVETQQPIALDPYDSIAASGAFVLADIATNHTVGAGMVRAEPSARD
jgi:sulfate adenylyltransferase subunit 1